MAKNRPLLIEFDGEGVSPGSLEPLSALRFAHEYLSLLQKLAEQDGKKLQFTGLTVEDKCAAVSTTPSSMTTADRASARANKLLERPATVPPSIERDVRSVLDARRALPTHYTATVITGKKKRPVPRTEWRVPQGPGRVREAITMRATVVYVGGKSRPKVTFDATAEERQFALETSKGTAKRIAPHLYDEVEITALLERDDTERIVDGELQEFRELLSEDSIKAWDDWYDDNDQEWSDVEDVEEELGRNGHRSRQAPPTSTH